MKRITSTLLAVALTATLLTGCFGGGDNSSSSGSSSGSVSSAIESLVDGATLESVIGEVNKAFGEYGAVTMPGKLEEQMLKDQYNLTTEDYAEFYGEMSMVNTNSDHLIAIKAKPGKVDVIKAALEKRKADLEKEYEQYPVNGSYDRAKAAKVYVRGDYVFLIAVGYLPEDPEADPEFEKQVQKAQDTIDKFFKPMP